MIGCTYVNYPRTSNSFHASCFTSHTYKIHGVEEINTTFLPKLCCLEQFCHLLLNEICHPFLLFTIQRFFLFCYGFCHVDLLRCPFFIFILQQLNIPIWITINLETIFFKMSLYLTVLKKPLLLFLNFLFSWKLPCCSKICCHYMFSPLWHWLQQFLQSSSIPSSAISLSES